MSRTFIATSFVAGFVAAILAFQQWRILQRLPVIHDPTPTALVHEPRLDIMGIGGMADPKLVPVSSGWDPGSRIEIVIFSEPGRTAEGELYSAPPRTFNIVTTDTYGTFGYGNAVPIKRVCDSPPLWLPQPFFLARDVNGRTAVRSYPPAYWFTFDRCN